MALTERGNGEEEPKPSDPVVQDVANTLGVKGFEQPSTMEERREQIRAHGGDQAVESAELLLAGAMTYERMTENPGDETLKRQFYVIVKRLSQLDPKALETVMATAIITAGELRKLMRKNGEQS